MLRKAVRKAGTTPGVAKARLGRSHGCLSDLSVGNQRNPLNVAKGKNPTREKQGLSHSGIRA